MVAARPWWTPSRPWTATSAVAFLVPTNVGRLGYCTDLGPRIVPMNYTLVGESVTFRTGIDTEASHQLFDHPVAFRS